MKPSHDATLLAHRQLADLQEHRHHAGLAPRSPPRKPHLKRNDSSPVRDSPPSPPVLKYRRVQSQQATIGATKRSHGGLRLAPRSHFLDEAAIDEFDCLYLGASPEDAEEYQARCVDNSGVSVQHTKRDKGKGKAVDQDNAPFLLDRRAEPRVAPLVFAVASPTAAATSRTFLHPPRILPNAAVSATSLSPAQSSASRASALASSSSSSSAAAASRVSSRRAASSVSSSLSASRSAASRIASRASILNAASPSLLASVQSAFTDAASVVSSRNGLTPSATSTRTSISSSTTPAPSSSSSVTSAAPTASTSPDASSGSSNRIRDIVVPSVVIPVALLLLAVFCFFCQRRRRAPKGQPTPSSFGAISNPMRSPFGSPFGASYGTGAIGGAAAGGAAGLMAGQRGNPSAESFATTPSAIGVAFSEPRTKWGRRSLSDVVAAGAVGAGSAAAAGKGRGQVISASSSFGGGRQPSITNMSELGSDVSSGRPYSPNAYRPGMPRPLMSPPGTQHYDPFSAPPSIVPVVARGSSTAWAAASSGTNSAYGSDGDAESLLGSDDRHAANLTPPMAAAVPYTSLHAQQAQRSRVDTQTSGEDVFYTDAASSTDEEDLTAQRPVDFGSSGSSGSEGVVSAAAAGGVGTPRQRAPSATPSSASTSNSGNGTPRLGAGHGSMGGVRKGDGSWW